MVVAVAPVKPSQRNFVAFNLLRPGGGSLGHMQTSRSEPASRATYPGKLARIHPDQQSDHFGPDCSVFGARCVKGTIKTGGPRPDDMADYLPNGDTDEIDVRLYVQMSDFSPNEHVRIYLFRLCSQCWMIPDDGCAVQPIRRPRRLSRYICRYATRIARSPGSN